MARRGMQEAMGAARSGELGLDDFARMTARDWDLLATKLTGKWPLPAGVDEEDVRQELLLGVLEKRLLETWDPAAGPTLSRYVVWNACSAGARFIHQQRAALRRSGKAPGRFAVPMSVVERSRGEDGEGYEAPRCGMGDTFEAGVWQAAASSPEATVEWRELLEIVSGALRGPHRVAFGAFVDELGDIERAAERIDEDPALALACRAGSVEEAAEVVRAAIAEVRRLAKA